MKDAAHSPEAAHGRVLDLLAGYMKTQCVATAARFGIPDLVREEPRDAQWFAQTIQADATATQRFLRALSSLGILVEVSPNRFGRTAISDALCTGSATLRDFAI